MGGYKGYQGSWKEKKTMGEGTKMGMVTRAAQGAQEPTETRRVTTADKGVKEDIREEDIKEVTQEVKEDMVALTASDPRTRATREVTEVEQEGRQARGSSPIATGGLLQERR